MTQDASLQDAEQMKLQQILEKQNPRARARARKWSQVYENFRARARARTRVRIFSWNCLPHYSFS